MERNDKRQYAISAMDIEIRDARREDARFVAWTVLTALDMETDNLDKFVASCSEADTMYSWKHAIMAVVDGVPAGCLIAYEGRHYLTLRQRTWGSLWDNVDSELLSRVEPETAAGEYYLDSMAILPEYRGRGIGRLLMTHAFGKGREAGCACSTLLVSQEKPKLEAYYRSVGCEKCGEMDFFGHCYDKMRRAL